MTRDFFEQLYDYTFWANRRLFDCVLALTEAQYRQPLDFSQGSIAHQLIHILSVEHWWIHFLATGHIEFLDDDAVYALPRESVRERWDTIERSVRAYLATLTPDELNRRVRPDFWEDQQKPIAVWQALTQVAHHSADHRVQALAMLHTQFGAPTFEQDFLSYLHRDSKPQA